MSAESLGDAPETFPLRGSRAGFALHATGVRHPVSGLFGGEHFSAYADVTHVVLGPRALRLATRSGVVTVGRRAFTEPDGAERLREALLARIAREPEGPAQLAHMRRLDERARRGGRLRAVSIAIALCAAVFVAERALGERVALAGAFGATLLAVGERWRLVTANFLHAGVWHLAMNVLGLLALGLLVERPLGSARTLFVLGASALGAMGGAALAGYEVAVGASGMVFGLAGAAVFLEFQRPEQLPAGWRIPRRLLVAALIADGLLALWIPEIAGFAHLGGFLAGFAAAAVVAEPPLDEAPAPGWLHAVDAALLVLLVLSFAAAARQALGGAAQLEQRAERLLSLPDAPALVLNNTAWMIVTSPDVDPERGAVAVRLAERAAEATGRRDPNVLDTLAEAQFAAGLDQDAVATIDEAIELVPDEPYYREQRRRFTGDRAREDRPAPPDEDDSAPEASPEEPPRERPDLPPGHPPIDGETEPGLSV